MSEVGQRFVTSFAIGNDRLAPAVLDNCAGQVPHGEGMHFMYDSR
jgi:hypothetical protein